MKSAITNNQPRIEIRSKKQLLKIAQAVYPGKILRVLTEDPRSSQKVAVCEQDVNGKLTVLRAGESLSMVGNFLVVNLKE